MKKLLSVVLSLVVTGSVFTFAFAEGATPTGTSTESKVLSRKAEVPQEVRDKKAALKELQANSKSLQCQLKTDKAQIAGRLKELFNGKAKADYAALKETRTTVTEANKKLLGQLKQLNTDLKQGIKENDKAKVNTVMDQIAELEQQINANKAEKEKTKEELQNELAAINKLKQKAQTLKAEFQPLRDEQSAVKDNLKSQQETVKSYGQELKSAYEAKDYTKVGSLLDQMTDLQKSINSNLTKLVEIKNKLGEKLSGTA